MTARSSPCAAAVLSTQPVAIRMRQRAPAVVLDPPCAVALCTTPIAGREARGGVQINWGALMPPARTSRLRIFAPDVRFSAASALLADRQLATVVRDGSDPFKLTG